MHRVMARGWYAVAFVLALGAMMMIGVVALAQDNGGGKGQTQDMCPDGTEFLVKFEAQGQNPKSGSGVTVTFADNTATFTSNTPIAAVVIKSGQETKTTTFNPPALTGSFSSNSGQDISNVSFCVPVEETTMPPEETTTPPEETTMPPEETTTPPEETTMPPEETTVMPPPEETTVMPPPEETTMPPEETTMPPEETTMPPEETTTPPEETTTVTVPEGNPPNMVTIPKDVSPDKTIVAEIAEEAVPGETVAVTLPEEAPSELAVVVKVAVKAVSGETVPVEFPLSVPKDVAAGETAVMVIPEDVQASAESQKPSSIETLPDTGGLPLGGVAAGLGVALVAGGLLLKRRLS